MSWIFVWGAREICRVWHDPLYGKHCKAAECVIILCMGSTARLQSVSWSFVWEGREVCRVCHVPLFGKQGKAVEFVMILCLGSTARLQCVSWSFVWETREDCRMSVTATKTSTIVLWKTSLGITIEKDSKKCYKLWGNHERYCCVQTAETKYVCF